jgi:hypothetical protein
MFAGTATSKLVMDELNGIGNVMNLESNAHTAYDNLIWGIEAQKDGEMVRLQMLTCCYHLLVYKVKYIYRRVRVPPTTEPGPGIICLRDGDEIKFGGGPDGKTLRGPSPLLGNLQLAVARVMKMSGAAELIAQWKDDADDSDFPHIYVASEEFCSVLDAQLLLSGQALIV